MRIVNLELQIYTFDEFVEAIEGGLKSIGVFTLSVHRGCTDDMKTAWYNTVGISSPDSFTSVLPPSTRDRNIYFAINKKTGFLEVIYNSAERWGIK